VIQPPRRRAVANEPEDVIRLLVMVNRLRRRYHKGHSRVRRAVIEFIGAVADFLQRRDRTTFRIILRDGNLTHDSRLLAHGEESVEELARLLTAIECTGIVFRADLTGASMNALLDWMAGDRERPAEDSCAGLEFIGASPIDRASVVTAPLGLAELDRVYQIAAASRYALEQIFGELRNGHALDLAQVNQLVQWIADRLESEGRRVVAPVFLSPPDPTPAGHANNVFLLALAVLHPYARDRRELESFCAAALLHDVGMARNPSDRGGPRAVRDAAEGERHPSIGADILLRCHGIPAVAIEVAFSHHLLDEGQGFPALCDPLRPSPVADVVQIADRVEHLTGRSAERKGASFPEALSVLMEEPAMQSKRDAIQTFLADLTPTPPGSLVRVRSGALGVVLDVNPDAPDRPRVALLQDGSGRDLDRPIVIDLLDDTDGNQSIVETLLRPPRLLSPEP